jgi:pimeloyl-ACP methyl ester carboxylesterase
MILHAIEAGPAPIPGGAPLVLLHGLFGQARNFGQIQRALAQRWRVIALDLRNHGASPHAPDMRYTAMAEDVLETLAALGALPAMVIGHSMGGKVAMGAALAHPEAVERLLVADIAPVVYRPHNAPIVAAMQAVPLREGLTRSAADVVLADAVPEASVRAFLLQNLRLGAPPTWRIGLAEIEAAMADIEGWDGPDDATYPGRTLFMTGEASNYVRQDDRPTIRALFPAARFVALKHAGHWLHADNPAGFLAVVEAFLSAPGAG